MPLAHHFTASPPNNPGYFSPQTSAVNFCEIDYEITPYIAEFINTLTNLTYIYFAFSTLPNASQVGYRHVSPFNPLKWPLSNIALILVGVGSGVFHATLRHTPQIFDEVGMYAIVASLNYSVYASGPKALFSSSLQKLAFAVVLLCSTNWVSYTNWVTHYHASHDFDIHTTLFVVLLTTFWPRLLWLIRNGEGVKGGRPSAVAKEQFQARLLRFRLGCFSFGMGFAIWLVDGYQCSKLRDIRASIGLPWAWLLEFHGTWHILTAIGAGVFVKLVEEVTSKTGRSKEMNGHVGRDKAT